MLKHRNYNKADKDRRSNYLVVSNVTSLPEYYCVMYTYITSYYMCIQTLALNENVPELMIGMMHGPLSRKLTKTSVNICCNCEKS